MNDSTVRHARKGRQRINWVSIATVLSAAVLIGAEVFGAAYAGGWALAGLFGLEDYLGKYAIYVVQAVFCATGLYVMFAFVRAAARVEPFVTRE
jgi:hypothetical protein